MDLTKWAINIAIAFLVLGLLVGSVAGPMAKSALDALNTTATSVGYTATAQAALEAKTYVDKAIFLIAITVALFPILSGLAKGNIERKLEDLPKTVVSFSVGLLVLSVLVFQLGLPTLVTSKIIEDTFMAIVVKVIPIVLLLVSIAIMGVMEFGKKETNAIPVRVI